ncbi:hypothetical protein ABEB36_011992 [Hypothenemus hampei]|uniref:Prokaryotic-type class I peptide chain release factors domain-containing protein n=1 Tax=Hypothenemus hampei TaxID=57062 RepID=A0ABD1E9S8_HYPHA
MLNQARIMHLSKYFRHYSSIKKLIDYSQVPTINDSDIEIQQVKGSGPGGSKINTTSSCIVLKHISTGIVVKCQETRSVEQNKKLAKLHLTTKLDNLFNGENSVEAQIKRLQERKSHKNELKKQKLRELKEKWKESLPD